MLGDRRATRKMLRNKLRILRMRISINILINHINYHHQSDKLEKNRFISTLRHENVVKFYVQGWKLMASFTRNTNHSLSLFITTKSQHLNLHKNINNTENKHEDQARNVAGKSQSTSSISFENRLMMRPRGV